MCPKWFGYIHRFVCNLVCKWGVYKTSYTHVITHMPLTDTAIRNAKPTDKPYSKTDEKGLSILVRSTGAKWWRFRYRFDGKAKRLSITPRHN